MASKEEHLLVSEQHDHNTCEKPIAGRSGTQTCVLWNSAFLARTALVWCVVFVALVVLRRATAVDTGPSSLIGSEPLLLRMAQQIVEHQYDWFSMSAMVCVTIAAQCSMVWGRRHRGLVTAILAVAVGICVTLLACEWSLVRHGPLRLESASGMVQHVIYTFDKDDLIHYIVYAGVPFVLAWGVWRAHYTMTPDKQAHAAGEKSN